MIGPNISIFANRIGSAFSYMLDFFSGAAAAYSLRRLSSSYGGSAIRVRRSRDNAEADIGFGPDGLNTTALMNHVGYENLLTNSESITGLSTLNVSLTNNTTSSPTGTLTGGAQLETAVNDVHLSNFDYTGVIGQQYTYSVYVKSIGGRYIRVAGSAGFAGVYVVITDTGAVYDGAGLYTVTPAANGWFRVTISAVATTTTVRVLMYSTILGGTTFLGDTTKGINIWGRQLNQGVTAQPYQQTVATANTANGFVTTWYTQDSNWENLLLQSQTFENASWTKTASIVASDQTQAPDGTNTADKLNETTVNSVHLLSQGFTGSSRIITYSVYLKAAERNIVILSCYKNSAPFEAISVLVDLTNGATRKIDYNGGSTISFGSIDVGNGWYRVWIHGDINGGSGVVELFTITGTLQTPISSYLGVAGSGVYIWGAQLSQSSWLQGYQATTTTAVSRRNATQTTAASQPAIVRSGVIELDNGKPALYFSGSNSLVPQGSNDIFRNVGFANMYAVANAFGAAASKVIYFFSTASTTSRTLLWSTSGGFAAGGRRLDADTFASAADNNYTSSKQLILSGLLNYATSDAYLYKLGLLVAQNTSFQTDGNTSDTSAQGSMIGATIVPDLNWVGDIQELILYNTNTTSNVLPISSSQNSFYQAYWQGSPSALLNQFGGSAAAYSLRNLSSQYTGPLVRVRRSSDNAETDIGGTFSGDLDVASLVSFTGGQNLILQSETFESGTWTKFNVTATSNATISPSGTLTADKISETASNGEHGTSQVTSVISGIHTISLYVKAAERNIAELSIYQNGGSFPFYAVSLDLITGEARPFSGSTGVQYSHSATNVGNGWWRLSVTGTTNVTSALVFQLAIRSGTVNSPITSYLGVAGSGVYVWGAQLNTGVLQPYVPTTTAAINGANAFVTTWYDQSGNARHATQATAGSQPRIVNAGGVESEGGRPAVFFDGTEWLNTSTGISANSGFAFCVYNSKDGQFRVSQADPTAERPSFGLDDNATTSSPKRIRFLELMPVTPDNSANGSSDIYNRQTLATYSSNGSAWSAWVNGASQSLSQVTGVNSGAWFGDYNYPLYIQRLNRSTPLSTISYNQEIIIYNTDHSAGRADIESNINNYYKIY
jgi:hypothetical protein